MSGGSVTEKGSKVGMYRGDSVEKDSKNVSKDRFHPEVLLSQQVSQGLNKSILIYFT